ncbi:hypothetical protein VTK56DRAFT_6422 [Thermocarpiscus australiensis]
MSTSRLSTGLDVAGATGIALSDGQRRKNLATRRATGSRWDSWSSGRPTGHSIQAAEWDVETLVDPIGGSLCSEGPEPAPSARSQRLMRLPCPFRVRNPARFNVRDHELCAKALFDSIYELKHHIISYHRRKRTYYQCPRCNLRFDMEAALQDHLLLPKDQMCEVNWAFSGDPEDGITDAVERRLVMWDDPADSPTWDCIWHLIFPNDVEVPMPEFLPVVELAEVDQKFDESQEALKASLREKLTLLLPSAIDDDYCGFLAGQLELVVDTYRANVMRQALSRSASTASGESSPSSQPTEQQDPPRPTRRSRRSTLLQNMQQHLRRTAPEATEGTWAASHRHSRESSTRYTGCSCSKPLPIHRTQPHTTSAAYDLLTWATIEPTPTELRPVSSTQTDEHSSSPRDSVDSGIGMCCDTCELDVCRCSTTTSHTSDDKDSGLRIRHDADTWSEIRASLPASLPPTLIRRPLEHQPRLSIRTSRTPDSFAIEKEVVVRDGFSPQSFKQRVLRKQLMGD